MKASTGQPIAELSAALRSATEAKKCHRCGCFRGALEQLDRALPALPAGVRSELAPMIEAGRGQLVPAEYDCLGCAVCWPADALNLAIDAFPEAGIAAEESCPTAPPERVTGWPPLPGNYRVLDAGGDVAICVLTSEELIARVAEASPARVAIVGAVYTENLGLERMIANVLANPNLTTLLVCGADSRQRIGHLPGQSLLSLRANGLDERGRIVGAEGRRPIFKNLPTEHVEEFRRAVSVVDLLGEEDVTEILQRVHRLPTEPRRRGGIATMDVPHIRARAPERLVLDPTGYFVVLPDRRRGVIVLEHYRNDGVCMHVLEGTRAEHLFSTAAERGLVSRLDHAAYLGKELALAERALATGEPYVQDKAPELGAESACRDGCGCSPVNPSMKEPS